MQAGAAVAEFRAPHQDELELSGDQHLQDRRQHVRRDPERSGDLVRVFTIESLNR
jgi:hypothetical protein